MKDRALRRHQEAKVKNRKQKDYTTCIGDLPESEKEKLDGNIEKLKKACVATHLEEDFKKENKKTVQEMKHDITMKEQIDSSQ